eukprot:4496234-Prorocentrum_lima.AAC.1
MGALGLTVVGYPGDIKTLLSTSRLVLAELMVAGNFGVVEVAKMDGEIRSVTVLVGWFCEANIAIA